MTDSIKRGLLLTQDIPPDFDMIDSDEDISRFSDPLSYALKTCRETVTPAYDSADKLALRHQKYHRILTGLAVVFGTIAVLFAIIYLSGFFPTPWPMLVEVITAIIALLAVILGLIQARQTRWLLQRYIAERCRMLKFHFLIDPDLWSKNPAQIKVWEDRLREEVRKIKEMTPQLLRRWIKEHEATEMPSGVSNCEITGSAIKALIDYYRDKRLNVQMHYFQKRAHRYEGIDRYMRNIPPMFFFLSVLSVLGHFSIDIFFEPSPIMHNVSVSLIVLAASFPLLGAGIRTLRSAHEFARSASLFRAKHAALEDINDRLNNATECQSILRILWRCEQFLEAEHLEWLRLMIEAEWFG